MITVTATQWRGLPAWLVGGDGREAVVAAHGASLACLRLVGEDLNPLWQPPWPSAAQADPNIHGDSQGEGPLLATTVGSLLCLDHFGPPRPDEGGKFHGEAAHAIWNFAGCDAATACFTTRLPTSRLAVERRVTLAEGECRLATTALSRHRPHEVEWCEHLTLGDPFLAGATITAGIDRLDLPGVPAAVSQATDPEHISRVLAMPLPGEPPRGDLWSGRVLAPAGWWCASHESARRRLTVRWSADDFPWLVVWTEHCKRDGLPWNGRTRAKGLELSTKPYPADHAYPETRCFGRPTQCHLPAAQPVTRTVKLRWEAF